MDMYVNKDGVSFPVFSFQDQSGSTVTFRGSSGTNPPSYKVGDMARILYDVNISSNARVDSFFELWVIPGITTVLGGFLAFFGIGFYIKNR